MFGNNLKAKAQGINPTPVQPKAVPPPAPMDPMGMMQAMDQKLDQILSLLQQDTQADAQEPGVAGGL